MNQPFTHVEDYIEFIAGWRERNGRLLQLFQNLPSPLSLARYDVAILNSLGVQTALENRAYTDKQAELAKKIVFKYRRQLANLSDPIIVPERLDNFRLGVREVDRTKSASVHDGVIWLRFPYDADLIRNVKEFSQKSQGFLHWDKQDKVWKMALTEYNVGLVMTVFKDKGFDVDSKIEDIFNKILECEKTSYRIELVKDQDRYKITNAETSLIEYLEQELGSDCWTDLIKLCDLAEICGYTISQEVEKELKTAVKKTVIFQLIRHRKFGIATEEFDDLVEYAKLVNRLPMHYYTGVVEISTKSTDEIVYMGSTTRVPLNQRIKLLATTTSLLIGRWKRAWLQNAEKIVELI